MKSKRTLPVMLLALLLGTTAESGIPTKRLTDDPSVKDVKSGFILARHNADISIYTRWIPVDKTRSTRQLKAVFEADASVDEVLSVLKNERSYLQWMRATKEYYRVKTVSDDTWYSYVQFSVPWPLNNQDCILKYEIIQDQANSKIVVTFSGEPGFLKEKDRVERIPHMEGYWVLTKAGNNRTAVEYYVYSKQAPRFPVWITDPIIQKNLLKTMQGLRRFIEQPENKN